MPMTAVIYHDQSSTLNTYGEMTFKFSNKQPHEYSSLTDVN